MFVWRKKGGGGGLSVIVSEVNEKKKNIVRYVPPACIYEKKAIVVANEDKTYLEDVTHHLVKDEVGGSGWQAGGDSKSSGWQALFFLGTFLAM